MNEETTLSDVTTDTILEDITDIYADTLMEDVHGGGGDMIKCTSTIKTLYGPYNKDETSIAAEIFPFPNDYYTVIDVRTPTGIRLNYTKDTFLNGINELGGFPTYPFLVARFFDPSDKRGDIKIVPIIEGKFNKRSFSDDSIFLIPLDILMMEIDYNRIQDSLVPLEIHSNENGTIFALVREILSEEREYVFFITDKMKVRLIDQAGDVVKDSECISTPLNFEAIKLKRSVESRFPNLEPYRQSLVLVFDALEEKIGIKRENIIVLSRFKTGYNVSIMRSIKEEIDRIYDFNVEITDVFKPVDSNGRLTEKMKEYLPCAADIKGIDEFYDYDFSNVDSIVIGYYDSPDYLTDRNRLNYDAEVGKYKPIRMNRVEFILILPVRDDTKGLVSPSPVVLFQHAFEVCKETSMAIAGTFSSSGFAIGGVDMIGHGRRSGKPRCADGRLYCDTPAMDFIKVDDMLTTVNWLRQSAIDTIAFYRMLHLLSLDIVPSKSDENGNVIRTESGDGVFDYDISRSLFTSQSLGSYLGISIVSILDGFISSVFNVPAAAFYKLLSHELSENGEIWELKDMYLPFIISIQTLVDEIEVLNFTKRYFREGGVNINVLIQAAKNDKVVPHNSTEMLAYFMGLEQVDAKRVIPDVAQVTTPRSGSYHSERVTAGYYQFDPAEHIFYLKSFTEGVRESAQYQSAAFLRSSLSRRKGGGLILDPYSCEQVSDYVEEAKSYPLEIDSNKFCR